MNPGCDRCPRKAAIYIRYSGQHLCQKHFLDLIRRRISREMRKQKVLSGKGPIGIAVSGGKDSMFLLDTMLDIVIPTGRKVKAISIDEGIPGYRSRCISVVSSYTKEKGIDHIVVTYNDLFGSTIAEMKNSTELGNCTICGILRRSALNRAARKAELSVLCTGHNLDDMAQTVMMNVFSAEPGRILRLGPHAGNVDGLVPRRMPLRTTPESEIFLAAILLDLPFVESKCPYSVNAKRGHYRDLVLSAEDETPGSRNSLLRFRDRMMDMTTQEDVEKSICSSCGEPFYGKEGVSLCSACRVLDEIGS